MGITFQKWFFRLSGLVASCCLIQVLSIEAWAHGTRPHGTPGSQPSSSAQIVEFRIPPGTGSGSWNLPSQPMVVRVGQILRIINDDSTPHLLHALGEPCEHGEDPMNQGEHYDCPIKSEVDPETTILYDHRFGSSARFYLKSIK